MPRRKKYRSPNEQIARDFGATVEKALDGKYNFFTHPHNCAFGYPLMQREGDYDNRPEAWDACGAVILCRREKRPVSWVGL